MQRARHLKYIYGFQEALYLFHCFFVFYNAVFTEVDANIYTIYSTSVAGGSAKNLGNLFCLTTN